MTTGPLHSDRHGHAFPGSPACVPIMRGTSSCSLLLSLIQAHGEERGREKNHLLASQSQERRKKKLDRHSQKSSHNLSFEVQPAQEVEQEEEGSSGSLNSYCGPITEEEDAAL